MENFKVIHIGTYLRQRWEELEVSIERTCAFLDCEEPDIFKMFKSESLDSKILLKWSKLLEYDFFRLYSQHLILYAPPAKMKYNKTSNNVLPAFKKNIYTREIIDFILELIENDIKSPSEIHSEYKIPKTTLYKWKEKYGKRNESDETEL